MMSKIAWNLNQDPRAAITLNLKESQWAELVYALKDKIRLLKTGELGSSCGM